MVARSKLLFIGYCVGVILFFGCIGVYLSGDQTGNVPSFIEWIGMPGTLLAVYGLVGVHSDHFVLASILANIGIYLLVPYLVWKLFGFLKKPRSASPNESAKN